MVALISSGRERKKATFSGSGFLDSDMVVNLHGRVNLEKVSLSRLVARRSRDWGEKKHGDDLDLPNLGVFPVRGNRILGDISLSWPRHDRSIPGSALTSSARRIFTVRWSRIGEEKPVLFVEPFCYARFFYSTGERTMAHRSTLSPISPERNMPLGLTSCRLNRPSCFRPQPPFSICLHAPEGGRPVEAANPGSRTVRSC
jgi:hypothetical protein